MGLRTWWRQRRCKHETCFLPVIPGVGPAPWKVCEACGAQLDFTREDGPIGEKLAARVIGATIVDVTGNFGRR